MSSCEESFPASSSTGELTRHANPQLQLQSRLFNLPAEIRNQIWEMVAQPVDVLLERTWQHPNKYFRRKVSKRWAYSHSRNRVYRKPEEGELNLLCVCHRMFAELFPMLLGRLNFVLLPRVYLWMLPKQIPKETLNLITSLSMHWDLGYTDRPLQWNPKRTLNDYMPRDMANLRHNTWYMYEVNARHVVEVCDVLKGMKSLKRVDWVIKLPDRSANLWDLFVPLVLKCADRARAGRGGWSLLVEMLGEMLGKWLDLSYLVTDDEWENFREKDLCHRTLARHLLYELNES